MASTLSPKLVTHLLLITILAVFAPLGQAQGLTHYEINGYMQNPLNPLPQGTSAIFKTMYITETWDQNSPALAKMEMMFAPQDGTWESNTARVWGVLTPQMPTRRGWEHERELAPFVVEGVMNPSDMSGSLMTSPIVGSARVGGLAVTSAFNGTQQRVSQLTGGTANVVKLRSSWGMA